MRSCATCGRAVAPIARFCTTCGAPLQSIRPAQAPTGVATATLPSTRPPTPPPPASPSPPAPLRRHGDLLPPAPIGAAPSTAASPLALPVATLFPLRTWLGEQGWWRGRLGTFAVFALVPYLLLHLTAEDGDITRAAWGFSLYFGLGWLLAMYALIRPERQHRPTIGRVVVFTAIAGVAIAIALEHWLAPGDGMVDMTLGVGVPEEFAKALPVYLFVFLGRRTWTTRTYLFIGAVSGLTFGVTEAVMYTVMYDDVGVLVGESSTVISIWRLLTGGFFHACLAAITAYFIGLAFWFRQAAWPLVVGGLALTSVLHGAYNTLSNGWGGSLVAAAVVFVFLGYVRSGDAIALELNESRTA